jgi:hypothetical protein
VLERHKGEDHTDGQLIRQGKAGCEINGDDILQAENSIVCRFKRDAGPADADTSID